MQVPSRLNEYPVGMTSPTTDSLHPRFSSLLIMRGNTDSEEDVPSTIKSSSLMYLMNFQMWKPVSHAIPPSTPKMKMRQVTEKAASRLPSGGSVPTPYLPVGTA